MAYISILNDSQDYWFCKAQPVVPKLEWKTMAPIVVPSVATGLTVDGMKVFGVPEPYLTQEDRQSLATGVGTSHLVTYFGSALSKSIIKYWKDNNYSPFMPGLKKTTTDTGVNSKVQVECKQISISDGAVIINTVWNEVMTGATKGKTIDYSIQQWMKKMSQETIQGLTGPKKRELEETPGFNHTNTLG